MSSNLLVRARSHSTDPEWGNFISDENWVKPPLSSLKLKTPFERKEALGQGRDNNNTIPAIVAGAAVAPAL